MIEHRPWRRRPIVILLCCASLALSILSCSDDATQQNALVAPTTLPGMTFRDTLIYAIRDSSFLRRLPMDGKQNLVGATGSGYTASALIQFIPGLFPARDTAAVFGATLKLYVGYRLGPQGGTLAFNVYRVSRQWTPSTLNWDSLQAGLYDQGIVRGTFSQAITADTGWISVPLDTSMVREWLRTTTSTDVTKFGIALVPTAASQVVVGFQSFEGDSTSRKPALTITAGSVGGANRDDSSFTQGIDTFSGDAPGRLDPSLVPIQAGVVYRGWLKFDVSFLSQFTVISSAQLMVDYANLPPSQRLVDTTLVAHLALGNDLGTFESSNLFVRPLAAAPRTLAGDVRHIVQAWLHGVNYGLVLRSQSFTEFGSFDRFDLLGTQALPAAGGRPRLRITYSQVNLERRP